MAATLVRGLYPDQLEAAKAFESWLINTEEKLGGLWASGGFGKSHMAKDFIFNIILAQTNYLPVLTSMTNSAVDILAGFTGMDVKTLHSLMGWVPMVDKDTGEEFLSTPQMRDKEAEPRLTKDMIVVVDEAGLMGHDELDLFMAALIESGARALLIGDHKQCYPVVKEDQELCIPAYEATETYFHLTVPKRVDPTDMIYKLSTAARGTVDGAPQPKLTTALNSDGSGKGVRHVDDIEELAYLAFAAGVRDGNTRNIKVLAFTNIRCINLNRKIRKNVLGLSGAPTIGEEMVANSSITDLEGEVAIRNNQLIIVKDVEPTVSYGLEGAFLQYTDSKGEDIEGTFFVPNSPAKLVERLKQMANEAKGLKGNGFEVEALNMWRAFYSLKEGVADIRFTYAMTVNKAQGITLKHALVDLYDINSCRDPGQAARLAYTAYTRPTDFLTIEGELDGSEVPKESSTISGRQF